MADEPSGWWMHHGDEAHTGRVSATRIDRSNVGALALRHELTLDGPVLSTPAVVGGYVWSDAQVKSFENWTGS